MMPHLAPSRRWLLAGGLVLVLLASFIAGRLSTGDRAADADVQQTSNDTGDTADDADGQTYYCSMHPEIRSDDPDDTCPICGMDLIPMPDNGDEDDGDLPVLRLSERSARLLDIQTTPVERRDAETTINFVGKLDYDETRLADVVARSDSYVERLHASYQWKPVQQGEVIAEMYSPAITAAARELRLVQRGDEGPRSPSAYAAARARLERLGLGDDQIDAIVEADEVPRTYELRSPIDGIITELNARQGDYLNEGQRLVRIVDLSTLWLQLEAYESDLQWLRVDQPAEFTIASVPGHTFEGTVAFINPAIDDRTRTARVRVNVDNPDAQLRPGMFARGRVHASTSRGEDAPLLIPASAALLTGREAVVYVRQPDTNRPTFEGRRITLGPRVGEHYIVREGLAEGERVVSRGAFKIDSELQVRGRPSMMSRAELFGEEPESEPRIPDDHPAHAVDPGDVPEAFADEVAEAVEAYLDLVTALADDDFDAARAAAAAMHDHLLPLSSDALDEATGEAWEAVDVKLHEALHAMAEADDLDAMRDHLPLLTDYTALAATRFAGDALDSLYRLHCPMAFDDEGADWLQDHEEVANPYFGASMLRCGTVEETLVGDAPDAADAAVADDEAAPYPLEVCIVTDLPLDAMGGPVRHEHEGQEIKFCCAACLPQFEDDPEAYLSKLDDAPANDEHPH